MIVNYWSGTTMFSRWMTDMAKIEQKKNRKQTFNNLSTLFLIRLCNKLFEKWSKNTMKKVKQAELIEISMKLVLLEFLLSERQSDNYLSKQGWD